MKIAFPEYHNNTIQTALAAYAARLQQGELGTLNSQPLEPIEPIEADSVEMACDLVKSHVADTMIAGIDYSSRDVIVACRNQFEMGNFAADLGLFDPNVALEDLGVPISTTPYATFSGLAVMRSPKTHQTYLLADMAACKHPSASQMKDIIEQTYASARHILAEEPRLALLSFSTHGSGGQDASIDLWQEVLAEFRNHHSALKIDGEMQLDAAIDPAIGHKKFPDSSVAGRANVLIAPDLNSGNILYKCFEHVAGYDVAGPILQGFDHVVADLSRGSTPQDILLTIEAVTCLTKARINGQ